MLPVYTQVAYGSKEWRTIQRTLREDEAAAAVFRADNDTNGGLDVDPMVHEEEQNRAAGLGDNKLGGRVEADGEGWRDSRGHARGGIGAHAAGSVGGKLSKLNLSFVKKATTKDK